LPTISIVTVPFKVRPNIQDRGQFAQADVENIGLQYPFLSYTKSKLFFDGKVSKHKWSFGGIVAPMALTTNAANTNNRKPIERTQLALSVATAISYSYNDITFSLIPAGIDYGINTNVRYWVYHGKVWWGFGIAIAPKILNKL